MTFRNTRTFARLCAATGLALSTAGGAAVGGNQRGGAAEPRAIAAAAALTLCRDLAAAGSPVVIVGPGLKWQRSASANDIPRIVAELVKEIGAPQELLISGRGRWVVVLDRVEGTALRMDCAANSRVLVPLSRTATSVDVSNGGDVAALAPDGIVVFLSSRLTGNRSAEPIRIPRPSTEGTGDLAWAGEQLRVFGTTSTLRIDFRGASAYPAAPEPLAGSVGSPRQAFWYNRVAYVLRDNCFHLYADANPDYRGNAQPMHQLPRSACFAAPAEYIVATPTSLIGLSSSGATVWGGPRPTVVIANFDGTTREVMAAASALAQSSWIPPVPLALDGAPVAPARTTAKAPEWRDLLDRKYWASNDAFERTMSAVQVRGWNAGAEFDSKNYRLIATGVTAHWQNRLGRVLPAGRTLSKIAENVYARPYTDEQITAIWEGSEALAETLEGRLVRDGWTPTATTMPGVGNVSFLLTTAGGTSMTQFFQMPEQRTTGERPLYQCGPSSTPVSEPLYVALTRGTKVAGGLGLISKAALDARSEIRIAAPVVRAFDCRAPGGFPDKTALGLENVRITREPQVAGAPPREQIKWPPYLIVAALPGGESWQLTGPLVIGMRNFAATQRKLDPIELRSLLDLLVPGYQAPLLVPVTQLQIVFAAPVTWRAAYVRMPNVSLNSAEPVPAQSRGDTGIACDAPTAAEHRKNHEAMLTLPARTEVERKSTRVMGLAENAVRREDAIFTLSEPGSVWAVAGNVSTFDHFNPQAPPPEDGRMSSDPKGVAHSFQVAGLLVSQVAERGLLDNGLIAWVNTNDTFVNNLHLVDRLAEKRSVVNVSVRLDEAWGLSDSEGLRRQSFRDGLLLIAAAANLDKAGQHGPPIIWHLPNVIGVGAVDPNRNIPDGSKYSRADIDLVAPGLGVPLHKVGGGMECHDGTSFATAYVTSIAALLLESPFIDRNPRLVRARLLATADWIPAYAGQVRGGLVNARRALQRLDKNILTLDPSPGTSNDVALIAEVPEAGAGAFEVSTEVDGVASRPKLQWTRLLRLQRLTPLNAAEARFRIVYVNNDNVLTIHDSVTIAASVAAPFTCKTLTGDPATCGKMPVRTIKDYVARYYTDPIVKF